MSNTQRSSGLTPKQARRVQEAFSLEQIKDEDVRKFALNQPTMTMLKRGFSRTPVILKLLRGRFKPAYSGGLNRYPKPEENPDSKVVSWKMFGSVAQNELDTRAYSTYGMFAPGEHEFTLGKYFERMNVLRGELTIGIRAKVGDENWCNTEGFFVLSKPGEREIIPAFSKVRFICGNPVRYICEYDTRGFEETG